MKLSISYIIIFIGVVVGSLLILTVQLQSSHHDNPPAKAHLFDRSVENSDKYLRGRNEEVENNAIPSVLASDSDSIDDLTANSSHTLFNTFNNSTSTTIFSNYSITTPPLFNISDYSNASSFAPSLAPTSAFSRESNSTMTMLQSFSESSSPSNNTQEISHSILLPNVTLEEGHEKLDGVSDRGIFNIPANFITTSIFQPNSYSDLIRISHENIDEIYDTQRSLSFASKFDPVELLFRAMKNGTTCIPYTPSSSSDDFAIISAIQAAINEFHPKLFIEYTSLPSSQAIGRFTADRNPLLTNLMFSSSATQQMDQFCEVSMPKNLLLVLGHQFDSQVQFSYDCIQLIESLDIISHDLLPVEFEAQMGAMLCRCNMTYLPKELPNNPFFSAWDTMDALIQNSLEANDHRCSVYLESVSSFPSYLQPVRFSHMLVMVNTSSPFHSFPASSSPFSAYSASITLEELQRLNLAEESKLFVAAEWINFQDHESTNNNTFDAPLEWIGSHLMDPKSQGKHLTYSGIGNLWAKKVLKEQHPSISYFPDSYNNIRESRTPLNSTILSAKSPFAFLIEMLNSDPNSVAAGNNLLHAAEEVYLSQIESTVYHSKWKPKRNSLLFVSSEARSLQKQLYQSERDSYFLWSEIMLHWTDDDGIRMFDRFQSSHSVYMFGRSFGLLSLKLAKVAKPTPAKFILTTASSNQSAYATYKLSQQMNLQNIIIVEPTWSIESITALLVSPERADMMMLQTDILIQIINLVATSSHSHTVSSSSGTSDTEEPSCQALSQQILKLYSILISMGRVAYVQLPSWSHLESLLPFLHPSCATMMKETIFFNETTFLTQVCQQITFDYMMTVSQLQCASCDSLKPVTQSKFFRISFLPLENSSPLAALFQQKPTDIGLSVYSASWLNLIAPQKQLVLRLLIDLPLWKSRIFSSPLLESYSNQLAPWEVFLQSSPPKSSSDDIMASNERRTSWKLVYRKESWDTNTANDLENNDSSYLNTVNHDPLDLITDTAVVEVITHEFQQHNSELAAGKFSFIEHDSGMGYISTRLAMNYPNATIFSLERDERFTAFHEQLVEQLTVSNNPICLKDSADSVIYKNLYESPELFRYQLLFRNVLDMFDHAPSLSSWGRDIGLILSCALTSFVYVPNKALVSWAMYSLFGDIFLPLENKNGGLRKLNLGTGPYRRFSHLLGWSDTELEDRLASKLSELSILSAHPQIPYINFDSEWLLSYARASRGATSLLISPVSLNSMATKSRSASLGGTYFDFPIVRCDIVNMSRHVHHHYDYARDGHSRTYTMQITLNTTLTETVVEKLGDPSSVFSIVDQHGVHLQLPMQHSNFVENVTLPLGHHPLQHQIVHIRLARDKDSFPIPYVSVYGVTLITALRLGLLPSQRDRLFHEFLRLPLYEDMAPWNIVLMGQSVDYIDYDTRDKLFNNDIPRAYQVMTVLMNYKRTVEDFKKCSPKAPTVYGLPYVSDCVGGKLDNKLSCGDLKFPVPCSDGQCHSDYISCLRSLANIAEILQEQAKKDALSRSFQPIAQRLASSMTTIVSKFNDTDYSRFSYEEFLENLH